MAAPFQCVKADGRRGNYEQLRASMAIACIYKESHKIRVKWN